MHNTYIVSGLVDGAVAEKQALRRAVDSRHPEPTQIHYHKLGESCNKNCHVVGESDD